MPIREQVILIFARAPVPGKCKTRLIPMLGERGAARLQRHLTAGTLASMTACPGTTAQLWAAPSPAHPFFSRCRRENGVRLRRQSAGDLGRKMARALDRVLTEGAAAAVIVGTDCPMLAADDIERAFELLRDADAVLKPAADGGFVLLGSRVRLGQSLRGVAWSSGRELAQTRRRLRHAGLRIKESAASWDVDRPADLRRAYRAGLLTR